MIKVIMLMKRRPGMTISEFRDYYVLMEIWYPDEETFKACGEKLSELDIAKENKRG